MKVIFLLALLATSTLCWWDNGHMLVAQIAEMELRQSRPEVYKRANALVLSMNGLDYDIDNTFVTSSVWPDDIKDQAMSFWNNWHFYNKPVNPDGLYIQQSVEGASSNSMNCLERAMSEFQGDSEDQNFTMQKAIFIRYVLHVVGDIHQPLHNTAMFNATYPPPSGDLGGNKQYIYDLEERNMLLHAFWDQGAQAFQGPNYNPIQRPLNSTAKIWMQEWAQSLMIQFPKSDFNGQDQNMDFYQWSQESWQIAKDFSYPLTYETNQLTEEYVANAQHICKQRVALGGYRLANFLEMILFDDQKAQETLQIISKHSQNAKAIWEEIQQEKAQKNLRGGYQQQQQLFNDENVVLDRDFGDFSFLAL